MSPLTLNRIVMFLAVIGVFIAGVLSVQHIFQLTVPCGGGTGCDTVARHPASNWFGQPVAYFGLAGYVALFALALIRGVAGLTANRLFVGAGYAISAIGMVTSLYLQYVSFVIIQAKCVWCISQAVVMVASFGVYSYYFNKVITMPEADAEMTKPRVSEFAAGLVGLLVATSAVYGVMRGQENANIIFKELGDETIAKLAPENRNQLGPDDAPVTLVEFADLCCPTCRRSFPKLKEFADKYKGRMRVIYRHYPIDSLQGHEMAVVAAAAAEFAAEKGKFWEFAGAFTSTGDAAPTTRDGVLSVASSVGIDRAELEKALGDPDSKAANRMARDYADANGVFKI
ncbi:MAG TPA: vitamin K epoxide reductase family protein, partial [Fimbriimonas sp.]|nr:vitamin K epoxide reductase family protein [Fimbriimonas sp.]